MVKDIHLALYGNVSIPRGYCTACERTALILNQEIQCCDAAVELPEQPSEFQRMSEPEQRRRLPSKEHRDLCLRMQNYRCRYCHQTFGWTVPYHGKEVRLKIHWDHCIPYSFAQDNADTNFVASCHVCNQWKRDKVFSTMEDIEDYVQAKWEKDRASRHSNLS